LSGRSWQKPLPGSPWRRARSHPRSLRVREGEPGQISRPLWSANSLIAAPSVRSRRPAKRCSSLSRVGTTPIDDTPPSVRPRRHATSLPMPIPCWTARGRPIHGRLAALLTTEGGGMRLAAAHRVRDQPFTAPMVKPSTSRSRKRL
jgi:hypothetical protein